MSTTPSHTDRPDASRPYVGRFAPSPTGLLHAGSLVAALASWLDARAHGGQWLVRIEDVDAPRCVPGADHAILGQLQALGLLPDAPPVWQSQRGQMYQAALDELISAGAAYPCGCSRKDIAEAQAAQQVHAQRHHILPYPGTCRPDRGGLRGKPARAWRLDTRLGQHGAAGESPSPAGSAMATHWHDRRLGAQSQVVSEEVGDFVLRRADGLWAYQLAVVVDDAAQGVTHVVRGEDLADNTARQILLQQALGLPRPIYLHTPLVLGENGEKLSKQNGAQALDLADPTAALRAAAHHLGLHGLAQTDARPAEWLRQAMPAWRDRLEDWTKAD
jgi:glutamyl-Q tRNA(Asp) synthetase